MTWLQRFHCLLIAEASLAQGSQRYQHITTTGFNRFSASHEPVASALFAYQSEFAPLVAWPIASQLMVFRRSVAVRGGQCASCTLVSPMRTIRILFRAENAILRCEIHPIWISPTILYFCDIRKRLFAIMSSYV